MLMYLNILLNIKRIKKMKNENVELLNKFFYDFNIQNQVLEPLGLENLVSIEIPSNCYKGYNCVFCNRKDDEEKNVDLKELEDRILKLEDKDGKKMIIAGSNPLNHPDFFEIINFISKYFSYISTFGLPEKLQDTSYVKKLVKTNIKEISLPLYSKDPLVHDQIVGLKGNYDCTIKSIKNLKEAGIKVFIHSLLLKQNIKEISALEVFVANKLNCPFVIIPYRPKEGNNEENIYLNYNEIVQGLKDQRVTSLYAFPLCVQEIIENKQDSIDTSHILKLYVNVQKFTKLGICRECKKNKLCKGTLLPCNSELNDSCIKPFK